jgi:hypothetical protein
VAKILLVAGTPASGKTSFGDYLRDKKDFLHVDIEAFEGSYLHSVWVAALKLKDMSLFLNTLKERNPNTVISWGLPDDLQIADPACGASLVVGRRMRARTVHRGMVCRLMSSKPR